VRFRVAIDRVFGRIAATPLARAARLGKHAANVPRFPYVVFYAIVNNDTIRVLAVAHTKRKPGYWKKRR
jgi:hypothetical protein